MQYKYKKIIIPGAFGTIIGHKSSEEKEVIMLGDIGEYTYIYSEDLSEQPMGLVFEQIILSKSELDYLRNNSMYIKALEAMILKEQKRVPTSITPLQAKLQLLEIGLLDEVETLIVKDRKAELYWNGASQFLIDDEILLNMAAVIGLSQEQLNDLFLQASKL